MTGPQVEENSDLTSTLNLSMDIKLCETFFNGK